MVIFLLLFVFGLGIAVLTAVYAGFSRRYRLVAGSLIVLVIIDDEESIWQKRATFELPPVLRTAKGD